MMPLPTPCEQQDAAHQTMEELLKLQLAIGLEEPGKRTQPNLPDREMVSRCMFNVDRMAPPPLGLPVFSGLDTASVLLQNVVKHTILSRRFSELMDEILGNRNRSRTIHECVDRSLSAYSKQDFSKYQLAQKITFLATKRSQDTIAQARKLQDTLSNTDFSIKLCIFSPSALSFLDTVILNYSYNLDFHELMYDLQIWTLNRVFPPPLPIISDPEYMVPQNLERKLKPAVEHGGRERGYTIEKGEWVWTMSEIRSANGKKAWARIAQGRLVKCEDMVKMVEAVKRGLDGRRFESCRALVVIHSQDQIAMHRWQHFEQYEKRNEGKRNVQWSVEDWERIDAYSKSAVS